MPTIFTFALVTTRYHNGILVLTAALSGTFSNLLIPLQIGARDMTREHDFILVVFHLKCNMIGSFC
jgi:heme/copper-type cytochrome/quinol oxidase subunit 1